MSKNKIISKNVKTKNQDEINAMEYSGKAQTSRKLDQQPEMGEYGEHGEELLRSTATELQTIHAVEKERHLKMDKHDMFTSYC